MTLGQGEGCGEGFFGRLGFFDFGVDEITGLGLGGGFVNFEARVTTLAKEFWTCCSLLR